ncbi:MULTISPECIES: ATP-binding cassette domain-containing protein [Clostridium]|uniref:ABC transporter ATP-binding protein n=1 Tax=Clostridium cibarium TaxID=2762247 RepID=A0ABR8PRY1_9CLOT|nr:MULTISPECIES: ATP-binding cassette domain-containing protein [Clostridium]MBD7910885.1 ABC transporter ATP-binding protein [Clostridium cibarium]
MVINKIEHNYENFHLSIENIEIKENTIIGLVGENGAGKSTLMNLFSGYMKANEAFQIDDWQSKDILFIPSEIDIYEYLTVEEFIFFVHKYSKTDTSINDILEQLDLTDKKDTLIEELSQGMRKKLTLVPMFIKKYDFVILDEPFNSIDMNYIYKLKKYLCLIKSSTTILISSHILDTLVDICDKFILIEKGSIKKSIVNDRNIASMEREIFDRSI